MAIVYVLNIDGKPLMPTTRCGHVRLLLKHGKAKVVEKTPFTIQLLYATPDVTQPLFLGIDPGRTNIGLCVVNTQGEAVFATQVVTRNKEIPKLMSARKAHRQKHRNYGRRQVKRRRARKAGTVHAERFERLLPGCKKPIILHYIRNKEARFNNRKREEGWFTPTANQLLQTHVNAVKKIAKFVPITDVVLELNKFAFMQMDNPKIRPWEYQRGPLYNFHGSVKAAVAAQQDDCCIFCKKRIEHYHHLVPRHQGGSNTLPNIVGLCKEHHSLVHTSDDWRSKLKDSKEGLNKKYRALSVLNQICGKLLEELATLFPGHTYAISGRDTKSYREANNMAKDHWLDAYCIASVVLGNEAKPVTITPHSLWQFRRHDRKACHQEMLNRKYFLDGKLVATNRHKAFEQKTISLAEYRDDLVEKFGVEVAEATISRLVVREHSARMKNQSRALPGSLFVDQKDGKPHILQASRGTHNGMPNYYFDTSGVRHIASKCKFIRNNTGLRFVG